MKNLIWCTDIHLDFLDGPNDVGRVHEEFAEPLSKVECDGILITGDISLADDVVRHLGILDRIVNKPIYFVLGNHDFYGGSFSNVRDAVRAACDASNNLRYLTGSGPVSLSEKVALVGDDGWYDAGYGDPFRSPYIMSDWLRIHDYVIGGAKTVGMYGPGIDMGTVVGLSRKFAAESAERMHAALTAAAQSHEVVVALTHVPPWTKVHRHDGKSGSPVAHPWYTSKVMGYVIEEVAKAHPKVKFEVFCGHTHGKFDAKIRPNVTCHVGGSDYGAPGIAGTLQIP